jgi:ADP-ribosyl-[dinitrogen reductase] hydrolase
MITVATLVGCAIGDALGNLFEMDPPTTPRLVAWDGQFKAGGTFWKGEAGQYTDDTLMSVALSTGMINAKGFDPESVAKEYLAWYKSGNTRGIGGTTAGAMVNLKNGASASASGLTHGHDKKPVGDNGTAMRASPIGLVYRNDLDILVKHAITDASITHNSLEPQMGSVAVALATALLYHRVSSPDSVVWDVTDVLQDSEVKNKLLLAQKWLSQGIHLPMIAEEALAEIGTKGYVPETVGAAFFCLGATQSFQDPVVMAVKGGGDTDTTAAIVGAMAGTYYGLEGIPERYKDEVENFEQLQSLTGELENLLLNKAFESK